MKKNLYLFLGAVFVASVVWAARYPLYHDRWLGTGTKNATEQFSIQTPSAGASAIFVPGVTNTNALGTTALRFSNVFSILGNFSGPITASGGVGVVQSTAPRTSVTTVATLYATYTIPAGTVFLNTTNNFLCHSTGTVQTSIVQSTSPTTACS